MLGIAVSAIALSAAGASTTEPPHPAHRQPGILVLQVDDDTRPYVRQINDAFSEAVLGSPDAPAVYFESIDASRFGEDRLEPFRTWLAQKYQGHQIDLIVPIGEPALAFLTAKHGAPWRDALVLYLEAGGVRADLLQGLPHVTGMMLDDHVPQGLSVVRTVLPATRRVAVLVGGTTVDQARWAPFATKVREAGLEPIVITGGTFEQMVTSVSHLPPDSVLYILGLMIDANGKVLAKRPCERIAAAANVPSFSPGAHDLGCGVVGGLVRDWSIIGRLLGERALALLRETKPPEPLVHVPARDFTILAFDDRQLTRWRIPESRLPPGSAVLYRPHTLWNDYRRQVVAAIVVAGLTSALLGVLVVERHRRHRAELRAQQHLVVAAHLDRRAAMGELATSLAHELNQPLNAILQNAGVAEMLLANNGHEHGELKEIITDIKNDDLRASEIITRMRALLQKRELEVTPVEPNALARDAVALVRADARAREVRLEVDLSDEIQPIAGDRVHLQQVLLNLLLNAVDAVATMPEDRRRVIVRTAQSDVETIMTVEDRGTGIPDESLQQVFEPFFTTKGHGMGMGLAIAKGIIDAHDGRLFVRNNTDGGATVSFSIPSKGSVS